MAKVRTLQQTSSDIHTWFAAWWANAVPLLKAQYAKNAARFHSIGSLAQFPKRTGYMQDVDGLLEQFLPGIEEDWELKHGATEVELEDPWAQLPTVDAEHNDVDKGIPNHGDQDPDNPDNWETEPVVAGNQPVIYTRGVPMPVVIDVKPLSWRQAWRGLGYTVPAVGERITDGCPNPANGKWVNSLWLETKRDSTQQVLNVECRTRRVDQVDTSLEYHEVWKAQLRLDRVTGVWTDSIDAEGDLRQTYHGPTIPEVV